MSKNTPVKITSMFEIGDAAKSSIDLQVHKAFAEIQAFGQSKKKDVDTLKKEYHAQGRELNTHEKGQNTKIYSHETNNTYMPRACIFAEYCRAEHKGFSLNKITPEAVGSFLSKLEHHAMNTVNGYISAIEKLASTPAVRDEVAATWNKAIQDFKATDTYKLAERKDTQHRAFGADGQKIIEAIKNPKAQVAALVCQETGIRRNEACHFILNGSQIVCNGKNGKEIIKPISNYLKEKIAPHLTPEGRFDMSKHTLSHCWDRAAKSIGVESTGIHGLRHDKAQADVKDALADGKSVSRACKDASADLAHVRQRITWTYLR